MFNLSNVRGISGVELKAAVGFEGYFYILHWLLVSDFMLSSYSWRDRGWCSTPKGSL